MFYHEMTDHDMDTIVATAKSFEDVTNIMTCGWTGGKLGGWQSCVHCLEKEDELQTRLDNRQGPAKSYHIAEGTEGLIATIPVNEGTIKDLPKFINSLSNIWYKFHKRGQEPVLDFYFDDFDGVRQVIISLEEEP